MRPIGMEGEAVQAVTAGEGIARRLGVGLGSDVADELLEACSGYRSSPAGEVVMEVRLLELRVSHEITTGAKPVVIDAI